MHLQFCVNIFYVYGRISDLYEFGRTQFAKNCEEFGVYKNNIGYYKREELDKMLSGEQSPFIEGAKKLKV